MRIILDACSACGREQEFDITTPHAARCEKCGTLQDDGTLFVLWLDEQAEKYPLPEKRHLGDAVYVSVSNGALRLSVERNSGEHFIRLGPSEMDQLKKYEAEVTEVLKRRNEDE